MLVLYILLGIILLITIALFLPISITLKFNKELVYTVKVVGIKVFPNKKRGETQEKAEDAKIAQEPKGFFEQLKEKRGFIGAIKEILVFLKDCITPLKLFLKFVSFKNVRLSVNVVGEDAAKTAVDYGAACTAIYPLLSFVEAHANVNYKKIDVKADFEGKDSEITFSLKIKSFAIFILIFMVRIFNEYKKFSVRNGLQ